MGARVTPPVLEVIDLSFRYPEGAQALRHVNLAVKFGERVAVIGPNGAGKSTLFLHLNGTFRGEGEIFVQGQKLTEQTIYEIRKKVGLVFQDPNDQLFMPTVFEDVAFGPMNLGLSEEAVRERVQKTLAVVGMPGSETLTPHHLSMGQKKKIALATVLAVEPEILALDEPSSGLDPRSRRQLIRFLKGLPQTQMVATHDLDLVLDLCSRAILMDDGQVVCEGSLPDLFSRRDLLEAHGLEQPLIWPHKNP